MGTQTQASNTASQLFTPADAAAMVGLAVQMAQQPPGLNSRGIVLLRGLCDILHTQRAALFVLSADSAVPPFKLSLVHAMVTSGELNELAARTESVARSKLAVQLHALQTGPGGCTIAVSDRSTATAYDADGNTVETVNYPSNASSGRATVNFYNFQDQLIVTMTGAVESADTIGSPAADTSSNNDTFVSYYTLDNLGEVTETQTYNAEGNTPTASDVGPLGGMLLTAESTSSYDNRGRVYNSSIVSVSNGSAGTSLVTNYYYDADGNLIADIGATGAATKYVYNGADWNTFMYTTDGGQINNFSNVSIGSSTAYNAASGVVGDVALTQTQNVYDNDGNVIETITSDRFGTDANTSTGALGTPTTGVYARASYVFNYFDAADRLVGSVDFGTDGGGAPSLGTNYFSSNATGGTTTTLVDISLSGDGSLPDSAIGNVLAILTGPGAGERATVTGYNSSTTSFTFAALAVAPGNGSTYVIVQPVSQLTQTVYNAAGWLGETVDPDGVITMNSMYDMRGYLLQTIADYTNGIANNSSNIVTNYIYDGDGNMTSMEAVNPAGTNEVTGYIYGANISSGSLVDDNDLLYEVEYPDPITGTNHNASGHAAYNQAEFYSYDALGEQIGYTDRNLTVHTYSYDQLGRLTTDSASINSSSGVDTTVTKLGYTFNPQGELGTATSYNSGGGIVNQVSETYDGFGNLLTDAQAVSGNVSGGTPTVTYSYYTAADDRLSSIEYPDGQTVNYNYSGNGGLDTLLDRITNISSGSISQAYTYLGLNTPVTFTDGNGVELSYLGTVGSTSGDAGDQYTGLDRFGRIIAQNWTSSGAGVDQFDYGYNGDNDVTYEQTVTNTSSGTTNTNLAATSQLYTYDALNRLINYSTGTMNVSGGTATMVTATGEESWTLDAVGNWQSSTVNNSGGTVTTNRNNSAQNQVTSVGSATLYYDKNGNTTTDQSGQEYVYDAWNRLVTVKDSSGTAIASYTYDALGRQMTQTDGGITTDLYNSNQDQVLQENQGSLVTAVHIWSPFYVDAMIATQTNPEVTTNQSNGSLDTGFGINTSNHTTTTGLTSSPTLAVAAVDGTDTLVATMNGSTGTLLFYNASGGLDTSYGSGGMVSLSGFTITKITGLVVQSDGYIDLAVQNTSGGLIVVQLNSSGGAVDGSFGTSGVEALGSLPAAQGLVQALNGDLLVDGVSSATISVTALNPSTGSPDSSFNSSGTTYVSFNGSANGMTIKGMAIAPDGDVILAGDYDYTIGLLSGAELALGALTPAGTADSLFGDDGVENIGNGLLLPPGVGPLAVSSAGNIFFGTATQVGSNTRLNVAEYSSSGSLNTSFNSSGTAGVTVTGEDTGIILNIRADGQIVIGAAGASEEFVLTRFNANGSLDTTFGSSGIEFGANESTGLAMVQAANGETIMIGTVASGSGIILQEFHTLAAPQTLYVEYDANYDVTSLTNSSGGVLERYTYTPYGSVTVLSTGGTAQGDGTAASSFYGWVYTFQGGRVDPATGQMLFENRNYDSALGRWDEEDPTGAVYVNGPNLYQLEISNPVSSEDPSGLGATTQQTNGSVTHGTVGPVRVHVIGAGITFTYTGDDTPTFEQVVKITLPPGAGSSQNERDDHGGADPTQGYVGDNGSGTCNNAYGSDYFGDPKTGWRSNGSNGRTNKSTGDTPGPGYTDDKGVTWRVRKDFIMTIYDENGNVVAVIYWHQNPNGSVGIDKMQGGGTVQ